MTSRDRQDTMAWGYTLLILWGVYWSLYIIDHVDRGLSAVNVYYSTHGLYPYSPCMKIFNCRTLSQYGEDTRRAVCDDADIGSQSHGCWWYDSRQQGYWPRSDPGGRNITTTRTEGADEGWFYVSSFCSLMIHDCSANSLVAHSMIPLMGFCYMLQYMDKLALSQATLFNIRADLVWHSHPDWLGQSWYVTGVI